MEAACSECVRWREAYLLDQEQARKFLQVIEGSQLDCIITLALTSAMRLGEILALRWDEVDLKARRLQIRQTVTYINKYGWVESEPKSESGSRDIPLTRLAVDALRKHQARRLEAKRKAAARWKEQGLVFPNRKGEYIRRPRLRCGAGPP